MSRHAQLLPGGLVVLHPAAVLEVSHALRVAGHVGRSRDHIWPSEGWRELQRVIDQAAAEVRAAGSGSAAVPQLPTLEPVAEPEAQEPISTAAAAKILGCKERNVRDLCARGRFVSARRRSGRWVIDRAEVAVRLSFAESGSVASHLRSTTRSE